MRRNIVTLFFKSAITSLTTLLLESFVTSEYSMWNLLKEERSHTNCEVIVNKV